MIRFATSGLSSQTVGQEPFRLRQLLFPGMLLLMIVGLSGQALRGERSLSGWMQLERNLIERQAELADLQKRNDELQLQVYRLSNESLDFDYLDERARRVLGLTRTDETVIFNLPETP
jgi:cell division protein FtsB